MYKVLIAIDWENINFGNKKDWKFMENYPQKSIVVLVFHSDIKKSVFPVFPHLSVIYKPTPAHEKVENPKNSTDRYMIRTILSKVTEENYNEVIVVSDDRIFQKLKDLLEIIGVKTTIEYSDRQNLKKLFPENATDKAKNTTDNPENEVNESIEAISQILYNKHSKGHVFDKSSLFNTIKANSIFTKKFKGKATKNKIIEKLIEKGVLMGDNNQKYILQ